MYGNFRETAGRSSYSIRPKAPMAPISCSNVGVRAVFVAAQFCFTSEDCPDASIVTPYCGRSLQRNSMEKLDHYGRTGRQRWVFGSSRNAVRIASGNERLPLPESPISAHYRENLATKRACWPSPNGYWVPRRFHASRGGCITGLYFHFAWW